MVNQKHPSTLRLALDVWNASREKHPRVTPDLSEADLFNINLQGAQIFGSDLPHWMMSPFAYQVDLTGANLQGATANGLQNRLQISLLCR
jgi:uncharacterized protein YjbI with pentapeptide repeats